jgi:hypothetical protein
MLDTELLMRPMQRVKQTGKKCAVILPSNRPPDQELMATSSARRRCRSIYHQLTTRSKPRLHAHGTRATDASSYLGAGCMYVPVHAVVITVLTDVCRCVRAKVQTCRRLQNASVRRELAVI